MVDTTELVSATPTNDPTEESSPTLASQRGLQPFLNANALEAADAQVSPHVRVLSDSGMVPVYDLEALENLYARSTSSSFQISVQQSPKEESLFRPLMSRNFVDTFQNDKPFGFDGLRIQSQGTQPPHGAPKSKIQIHEQYVHRFSNAGLISGSGRGARVSKYADTKPNRWLQQAIKRGKQKRKEAMQQAFLHSQQALIAGHSSSYDGHSPRNGTNTCLPSFGSLAMHQTQHMRPAMANAHRLINHNKHQTGSFRELSSVGEQSKDWQIAPTAKLTLGIHLMTAQGRSIHSPMELAPPKNESESAGGAATHTGPGTSPQHRSLQHH